MCYLENTNKKKLHTRKNLRPTKYPRQEILDPRNNHDRKFWTHERTMAQDPRNLAHSVKNNQM